MRGRVWSVVAVAACGQGEGDGGSAAACLGGGEWSFAYELAPGSSPACPELAEEGGPAIASDDFEESCPSGCTCADAYAGCDYSLTETCDRDGQSTELDCALSLDPSEIVGTCTTRVTSGPIDVTCEYEVRGQRG